MKPGTHILRLNRNVMSLIATFLLTTALLAQEAPRSDTPPAPVTNPAQENAQKAKEVLQKAIVALGGDAYLKIIDFKQEGRGFGFYHGASTGVGAPFTRYYQYPDKERYEYFKDGEWVIIRNGDQGYDITWRGTREEEKKSLTTYLRRREYALDRILRGWAADPRTAFFYDGKTVQDAKEVHQVTLISPTNRKVTLYFDTRTGLPIRKVYLYRNEEMERNDEEVEIWDMYRVIQGINTPFVNTRMLNGEMTSQLFVRSVSYNTGVDSAKFNVKALNYNKLKR